MRRASLILLSLGLLLQTQARVPRKEINLIHHSVSIRLPEKFHIQYFPYEEGTTILIYTDSGSRIFLFEGGMVQLPLVNRDNAEIDDVISNRRLFSEFGHTDSLYFKEVHLKGTSVRYGYDHVKDGDISKYDKILRSIKIQESFSQDVIGNDSVCQTRPVDYSGMDKLSW